MDCPVNSPRTEPGEMARAATPRSEADLVAAARRGDGTAFEAIMRRNNRRLFRAARAILRNDAEAEDVVQETYVKAYTHLDGFAETARLSTWLTRIAVNEALGRLRRRMPTESRESLTDSNMTQDSIVPIGLAAGLVPANPEASAARGEIRRFLESAIDELPQAQRTVFMLRGIEEFSVADTAACLRIPHDTVKTRFHRAKRALRRALNEKLDAALADSFPFAGARCDGVVERVLQRLGLTRNNALTSEVPLDSG